MKNTITDWLMTIDLGIFCVLAGAYVQKVTMEDEIKKERCGE